MNQYEKVLDNCAAYFNVIYVFSYITLKYTIYHICYLLSDKGNVMNSFDPIQFFKCLADDTRLKALLLITQQQELCVCELVAALSLSQPKVSRHLAQLRKCELLIDRRQGQWVFYRLNDALPLWAIEIIEKTALNNKAFLNDSLNALNQMGDRPTRVSMCCEETSTQK